MLVVSTIHLDIIIIDIGVSFDVWIIVSSASFGGSYLSNVDIEVVDIESTIMAAVSGSCKHFCSCWARADSRIMTDGFHIYLATVDLEGICLKCLEVESTDVVLKRGE